MQMLAGALGLSVSDWTSDMIAEKWAEKFPDMEYPDEEGMIRHKRSKEVKPR
jgi:hypothetical protein